MQKLLDMTENSGGVLAVCGAPALHKKKTGNGVPLLNKGALNLYMNMPCPLKVVTKMVISEFADLYNASHEIPIYSPMLHDGDSKGIEGELKAAQTEKFQRAVYRYRRLYRNNQQCSSGQNARNISEACYGAQYWHLRYRLLEHCSGFIDQSRGSQSPSLD